MTRSTKLSSLLSALPNRDRVVAVEGPGAKLSDYEPNPLIKQYRELFDRPDSTIVCQMDDGWLLIFSHIDKFAYYNFGDNGIVTIYAVPNLTWQNFMGQRRTFNIRDLRGPRTNFNVVQPRVRAPLEGSQY